MSEIELLQELKQQIDILIRENSILKKDLHIIKSKLKIDNNEPLDNDKTRKIKSGNFNLPKDFSKKMLEKATLEADFKMFKEYYITDVAQFSIKKISQSKMKYWDGEKWVYDVNFTNLKKIIIGNIRKAYTRVNTLKYYENDLEQIEKNQEHINMLNDDNMDSRYVKRLIKRIKTEIEIIQLNADS